MGIRFCRGGLVRSVLCHCSHKQPTKILLCLPGSRDVAGWGGLRGWLWPGLCARWRLSTALFRWMLRSFSVFSPGRSFGWVSVVSLPFSAFLSRSSLPDSCFSCFQSTGGCSVLSLSSRFPPYIYEVFSCVASCASSVLSLCVPSVPVSSPFCNSCRPSISPFQFVPLLQCVFHTFLVCVLCPVVSVFLVSEPPPLLQPLPHSYLPLFCVRLLTHALYFPCVSFVPNSLSSCCSLPSFLSPSLGFPFPFVRVFSLVAPPSRCYSPFSPPPFPPLPLSFPRFPSPFLRSFPLLLLPLRKKFPLKSCMISSVKYMFYSIFLVCLGKFS